MTRIFELFRTIERRIPDLALPIALLAPPAAAAALIPLRADTDNANIALSLVVVVDRDAPSTTAPWRTVGGMECLQRPKFRPTR
jgi:hypothetical protein